MCGTLQTHRGDLRLHGDDVVVVHIEIAGVSWACSKHILLDMGRLDDIDVMAKA